MSGAAATARRHGEPGWLGDALLRLLAADTAVAPGEHEVRPGDPRVAAAVRDVVRPLVEELGPDEVRAHPAGDLAARFGPPGDDGLLVQTYVVTQHGDPAARPRVEGRTAIGPGASQHRGAAVAALAALRTRPTRLRRPVWLAVNTEGRSSHDGSRRVLDDLDVRARHAVLAVGTDLMVRVANRGRVDVVVTARGAAHHSSVPGATRSPIDVVADVIVALRTLPVPEPDPELGPALVTPYRVTATPVAPHTVPERVEVVVDHRLLPGDTPERAVAAVREHLVGRHGLAVEVGAGPAMLPARVAPDEPLVRALVGGLAAAGVTDRPAVGVSTATFDAGYGCAKGIPTCMFGPGRRELGAGLTAPERVALADVAAGAAALTHALTALCA